MTTHIVHTTASTALEGTNWSLAGSAQQYHGSVRYGTVARTAPTDS